MHRTSTRLIATLLASLLTVSLAALAVTGGVPSARAQTGGTSQPTQTTTAAQPALRVTCGRVTELADDHITIKPDNGNADRISLGARTRYVARSLHAAETGLHEGDFAAARGGDQAAGQTALAVVYADTDFCGKGTQSGNVRLAGRVAGSSPNSLTVRDTGGDIVTVNFTQATKFYVNGHLEQNPPAFKQGERVRVLAHRETDGSLNALTVAVRTD